MPKKVEPLPCLCGKVPRVDSNSFCIWTACRNSKCSVQPTGPARKTHNGAVQVWNRWITQGIRRLAKVVEEQP